MNIISYFPVEDINLSRVLLAIFIGYIGYFYYKNFYYPRHVGPLKSIPGPSNGLLHSIKFLRYGLTGRMSKFYKDLHDEYGPIAHSGFNMISTSDIEAAKIIYGGYKFKKDYKFQVCIADVQNIFSTADKKFHSIRKRIISPAFNMKSISELEPQMSLHLVDNTLTAINEILSSGSKQVYFYELFYKSIGDATSDIYVVPALRFLKSSHHPIVNQAVTEELKERRAGKYRKDILQALVDAKDIETKSTLTDEEIIEETCLLVFAGMESTALTLIWTFYLLGKYRQVYEKLVDEIVTTFPDKNIKISYDMCKDLPYLTAVIYEALRFKPTTSISLTRVVPEGGATLCGHFLPEGTAIGSSGAGIHFNEENYEKAKSFIPERWLGPDVQKLKDKLFNFGLGPRSCLGKNFAIAEMHISLANLIRQFDFSMPEDTKFTVYDLIALKAKEQKLLINITPRSN